MTTCLRSRGASGWAAAACLAAAGTVAATLMTTRSTANVTALAAAEPPAAPQHQPPQAQAQPPSLYAKLVPPPQQRTTLSSLSSLFSGRSLHNDQQQPMPWKEAYAQQQEQLVQSGYEAMPDLATVMVPSHALGALLQEGRIEAYRTYMYSHRSRNASTTPTTVERIPVQTDTMTFPERTAQAAGATQPQVVSLVRLGPNVDGHEGWVHGGILALLMDDVLGYGFVSLGVPAAVTAHLSVHYRVPLPAGTTVRLEATFVRAERRKLSWKVRVVNATDPSVLYAEATSLFVIPRAIFEQMHKADALKNASKAVR
jgi:acyl-coenzyme A thioesterase PaaI-like protein